MFAAQAGNADAVKALVAQGADVNAKEKVKGETALIFAPPTAAPTSSAC